MRVAILDLGTNTFNLLIAEQKGTAPFRILYNHKLPVKLGEGGINKGEIISSAFNRGIDAIQQHYETIRSFDVEKIRAFGTSALRTAGNGPEFIQTIKENTAITVEIISGDKEAELIYYGVRQTYPMTREKFLLLDIGGGSNEFIIADKDKIYWKKSYPLGIARLLERFHPSDPITKEEVAAIEAYLAGELKDLFEVSEQYAIKTLFGASGSFETFVALIHTPEKESSTESGLYPQSTMITQEEFDKLYDRLIASTTEERTKMKGLEPMRIEMIVLACHFVKFITRILNIGTIIQSNFSLKEGAIYELLKG